MNKANWGRSICHWIVGFERAGDAKRTRGFRRRNEDPFTA